MCFKIGRALQERKGAMSQKKETFPQVLNSIILLSKPLFPER